MRIPKVDILAQNFLTLSLIADRSLWTMTILRKPKKINSKKACVKKTVPKNTSDKISVKGYAN